MQKYNDASLEDRVKFFLTGGELGTPSSLNEDYFLATVNQQVMSTTSSCETFGRVTVLKVDNCPSNPDYPFMVLGQNTSASNTSVEVWVGGTSQVVFNQLYHPITTINAQPLVNSSYDLSANADRAATMTSRFTFRPTLLQAGNTNLSGEFIGAAVLTQPPYASFTKAGLAGFTQQTAGVFSTVPANQSVAGVLVGNNKLFYIGGNSVVPDNAGHFVKRINKVPLPDMTDRIYGIWQPTLVQEQQIACPVRLSLAVNDIPNATAALYTVTANTHWTRLDRTGTADHLVETVIAGPACTLDVPVAVVGLLDRFSGASSVTIAPPGPESGPGPWFLSALSVVINCAAPQTAHSTENMDITVELEWWDKTMMGISQPAAYVLALGDYTGPVSIEVNRAYDIVPNADNAVEKTPYLVQALPSSMRSGIKDWLTAAFGPCMSIVGSEREVRSLVASMASSPSLPATSAHMAQRYGAKRYDAGFFDKIAHFVRGAVGTVGKVASLAGKIAPVASMFAAPFSASREVSYAGHMDTTADVFHASAYDGQYNLNPEIKASYPAGHARSRLLYHATRVGTEASRTNAKGLMKECFGTDAQAKEYHAAKASKGKAEAKPKVDRTKPDAAKVSDKKKEQIKATKQLLKGVQPLAPDTDSDEGAAAAEEPMTQVPVNEPSSDEDSAESETDSASQAASDIDLSESEDEEGELPQTKRPRKAHRSPASDMNPTPEVHVGDEADPSFTESTQVKAFTVYKPEAYKPIFSGPTAGRIPSAFMTGMGPVADPTQVAKRAALLSGVKGAGIANSAVFPAVSNEGVIYFTVTTTTLPMEGSDYPADRHAAARLGTTKLTLFFEGGFAADTTTFDRIASAAISKGVIGNYFVSIAESIETGAIVGDSYALAVLSALCGLPYIAPLTGSIALVQMLGGEQTIVVNKVGGVGAKLSAAVHRKTPARPNEVLTRSPPGLVLPLANITDALERGSLAESDEAVYMQLKATGLAVNKHSVYAISTFDDLVSLWLNVDRVNGVFNSFLLAPEENRQFYQETVVANFQNWRRFQAAINLYHHAKGRGAASAKGQLDQWKITTRNFLQVLDTGIARAKKPQPTPETSAEIAAGLENYKADKAKTALQKIAVQEGRMKIISKDGRDEIAHPAPLKDIFANPRDYSKFVKVKNYVVGRKGTELITVPLTVFRNLESAQKLPGKGKKKKPATDYSDPTLWTL